MKKDEETALERNIVTVKKKEKKFLYNKMETSGEITRLGIQTEKEIKILGGWERT